jgi:hypothetical protein
MDKKETVAVASFGYSLKKLDATMIGQYGNGLKSYVHIGAIGL